MEKEIMENLMQKLREKFIIPPTSIVKKCARYIIDNKYGYYIEIKNKEINELKKKIAELNRNSITGGGVYIRLPKMKKTPSNRLKKRAHKTKTRRK